MTLYHGSPNQFDAFELGKGHKNGTGMGYGIYLTDSKGRAEAYAGDAGVVYTVSTPDQDLVSTEKLTLNRDRVESLVTSIAQQQIDHEQYPYLLSDWGEPTSETTLDEGNKRIINRITDNLMTENSDVDVVNSLYQELGGDYGSNDYLQNALNEAGLFGAERDFDGTKEIVIFNPDDVRIDDREEVQAEIQEATNLQQKGSQNKKTIAQGIETAAVAEISQPSVSIPVVGKAGEAVPALNDDFKDFWGALDQNKDVEDFWRKKLTTSDDLTMAINRVDAGTPRLFATITPNARKNMDWQLTKFDRQERPISHIEFNAPKSEIDTVKLISELPASTATESYRVEQLKAPQLQQQDVKLRPHEQAYMDLVEGKMPTKTDGNLFLAYDAGATLKERYSWRMKTIDRVMPYSHGKALEKLEVKRHSLQQDMLKGKPQPLNHETAIVRQAINATAKLATEVTPIHTKENGLSI